jgi:glycosyltransferase involved in cell wall biosynthesis
MMENPAPPLRKKVISIVTPCYNEGNLANHFARVCAAIEPFREKYDFEHIYTDNCSQDQTFQLLVELGSRHKNVKAIRFSRNIGANRAIYMGLMQATGDAAILIQADLQDPPELIPDFIRGWEEGYDVVYGQIKSRREGFIIRNLRRTYYKIIAKLADVTPPQNAGEFRLTSRRVLDAIRLYSEDDLYLRGAVAHIGYRQKALSYDRAERVAGKSNAGLFHLIGYAMNGLISTSTVAPIRAVTLLGFLTSLTGFAFAVYVVVAKLLWPSEVPHGISLLLAVVTTLAGIQMLSLGVIGEYIRKIYIQSLQRPPGFIQDKVNL